MSSEDDAVRSRSSAAAWDALRANTTRQRKHVASGITMSHIMVTNNSCAQFEGKVQRSPHLSLGLGDSPQVGTRAQRVNE